MPSAAAADWPASRGAGTTSAPATPARRTARGSPVTTATAASAWAAEAAASTSASIASASSARAAGARRVSSRCLAAPKRLTGRTASVRIAARSNLTIGERAGEVEGRPGDARAVAGRVHERVQLGRGKPLDRLVGDHPVDHAGVRGDDSLRACLDAGVRAECLGRPLDRPAADERADRDHGRRRGGDRLAYPRHGEDRADHDRLRPLERREHLGRRPRRLDPAQLDRLDLRLRPVDDHELLERPPPPVRAHVRAHGLVAHREHARVDAERVRDLAVRLGQAPPAPQKLGADEAQREIAVAEPEPRLAARPLERADHLPGVAAHPEAPLVDEIGEPQRHEVGVRRDVHAVDLDVVARVGDHAQLVAAYDVEHPARELRPAGAPGEDDYHRGSSRPVSRMPAVTLLRELTEISSGVRPSTRRAVSSAPALTARRPSMRSTSLATRRFGSRASPHTSTSSSSGWSRSERTCPATVWRALTTVTPSGTISWACWAADPCGTPSSRVALPETAAASGTVASTRIWPSRRAFRRFVRFSDCARKGTVRKTMSPRATAWAFSSPSTSPSGTRSRALAAASSADSRRREPMTTGTPAPASRTASPKPSAPVPPTMGTGEGLTRRRA